MPRNKIIQIVVSPEELKAIKDNAWKAKKPMSVYLRELGLSGLLKKGGSK